MSFKHSFMTLFFCCGVPLQEKMEFAEWASEEQARLDKWKLVLNAIVGVLHVVFPRERSNDSCITRLMSLFTLKG